MMLMCILWCMVAAIIGLTVILLFGLYIGHAPQSKWPRMEVIVASAIAFLMVCVGLFWAQKSQGACAPAGYKSLYGNPCKSILTLKNMEIGYGSYLIGLVLGLGYQLTANLVAKHRKAPVKK